MSDLLAKIVLSLRNEQFNAGLRDAGRNVERFTGQSTSELRKLRRDFQSLTGNVLGNFKGELLAIGTGWAGVQMIKDSAQLDKSLTRMTQTAGVAKKQAKELRNELFDLQRQYGVLVDDSRKANDTLLQSGLGWSEAMTATRAIAPATTVTGARPEVLAGALGVSAEIFDFDLSKLSVATALLDKMTVAGISGNAELEDLASIFSRVGGNAKRAGMDFDQTLGMIEQLSLREKNPERLATLVDSTLRIFTNQEYLKNVQNGLKIPFYDKKTGARRDSFDVIADISTLYKKQKTDLERDKLVAYAFGATDLDTQRGIQALLSDGSLEGMRAITKDVTASTGALARMLPDALNNSVDQAARLRGVLRNTADGFSQGINAGIDAGIQKLLNTKAQGGWDLSGGELVAGGAAALAAGGAAYRYGPKMLRKLLGKGGDLAQGLATGKALEQAAGIQPVYVVNMPDQMGSDIGMPLSKNGKRWSKKAKAGGLLAAGLAAYSLHDTWSSDNDTSSKLVDTAGLAGGLAGGWGGAKLGAAIGTAIAPGVGTIIGGILGGWAGYAAGDYVTTAAGNAIKGPSPTSPQPMEGFIRIEVGDERTSISRLSATGFDMDVSGTSMVAPQ